MKSLGQSRNGLQCHCSAYMYFIFFFAFIYVHSALNCSSLYFNFQLNACFSLCWIPIDGLELVSALWSGCCLFLFETFPVVVLYSMCMHGHCYLFNVNIFNLADYKFALMWEFNIMLACAKVKGSFSIIFN